MLNFDYWNPTHLVFGQGTIARLAELTPRAAKVMLTYGGGSIKRNGVYEQIREALKDHDVIEFGGIEPNPRYETCMKAVELARNEKVGFLIAAGGGSTLDGTKFISASIHYKGDLWAAMGQALTLPEALPIGCVLTLPATGSESNGNSVISRDSTGEKLHFASQDVYPKFAILDPETTFSLPERQTANGTVDAFVHVMEQYLTYPADAPLQDRQAEALLSTLIEEGPKALVSPHDYNVRANLMWCATQALNNLIGSGVPQDWATHMIGHEITAFYGLDHAQTLACVLPAMMRFQRAKKSAKILQYGARVLDLHGGSDDARIDAAIDRTEDFFRAMGVKTRLAAYGVTEGLERVGARFTSRGTILGEHSDITGKEVDAIIALCKA